MAKKKDKLQDKKLRKRLEGLVASAEGAAQRAEKAAAKARKHRKRAESAAEQPSPVEPVETTEQPSLVEPTSRVEPPSTDEQTSLVEPVETTAETTEPDLSEGGPTVSSGQLARATKAQLVDLARGAGIPGRTRMTKDELVAALGG